MQTSCLLSEGDFVWTCDSSFQGRVSLKSALEQYLGRLENVLEAESTGRNLAMTVPLDLELTLPSELAMTPGNDAMATSPRQRAQWSADQAAFIELSGGNYASNSISKLLSRRCTQHAEDLDQI